MIHAHYITPPPHAFNDGLVRGSVSLYGPDTTGWYITTPCTVRLREKPDYVWTQEYAGWA